MSKYIKLYDAIMAMAEWFSEPITPTQILSDLPTIEVSEDCISKHDIWKIIEDNAYWVRYNENSKKKGMTLTGINQALNECPPVIPSVSEDCISREYILGEAFAANEYNRETKSFDLPVVSVRDIEDAPSVVPSRAEGEWLLDGRCSNCLQAPLTTHKTYCPNCGARMKG